MNVREATLQDLPPLLELEQAVIEAERPFNDSIKSENAKYYDIENLIADNDSHLIVLEDSGTIVGTGYAQIRKSKESLTHLKHSYLGFMFVAPEYRGKGLNQILIDHLISWSKAKGVQDFYLDVYAQNSAAIGAYAKAGFEPCLIEMKLSAT